jgi:hypothetical protein
MIFDENHEVPFMLFGEFLAIPKRLSKGVRQLLLDETSYLVLLWPPKTAFMKRNHCSNTLKFHCVLRNFE